MHRHVSAFALAQLLLACLVMLGCARSRIVSIRIELPDRNGPEVVDALHRFEGQRLQEELRALGEQWDHQAFSDLQRARRALDGWAARSDFDAIQGDGVHAMRLTWVVSQPTARLNLFGWKERKPAVPRWPMQLGMMFDPAGTTGIDIKLIDASHVRHTERFNRIAEELNAEMVRLFGGRIKTTTW